MPAGGEKLPEGDISSDMLAVTVGVFILFKHPRGFPDLGNKTATDCSLEKHGGRDL